MAQAWGYFATASDRPRLSDLIVSKGPSWLQNPVNSYLAGDPNDSAAIGRAKNALESIGVDVALAGVFAASLKGFALVQARKAGTATPEAADAALSELGTAVAHQEAKLAASKGDAAAVEALREAHPQAVADAEAALALERPAVPVADALASDAMSARSPRRSLAEREAAGEAVDYGPDAAAMPASAERDATVSALPEEVLPGAGVREGGLPGTVPAQAEPSGLQLLGITDDQVSRLIAHGRADTEQLLSPGGWDGAIERGYRFGDGGRIPWQKLSVEPGHEPGRSPLDQVIRRVSDEFAGEIAAAKGGDADGVLSDAMADRMVAQRVANNLLWGLRTHFVNLSTNLYMVGARPLERMIGGAVQGDMARVAENARQYGYLFGAFHESWRDAVRTWQTGESILAPHAAEVSASSAGRSVNWVAEGFRPWDSIPSILSNAYTGFMKAAGTPTRALGAVDELVKQAVYRSKVQAAAHGEGIAAGLEGPALTEHVRRTLDAAFDDAGRAVDLKALEEANIATFQQDLLPKTLGSGVQGMVQNVPALRFVLPFVKTPTNVLRMGWKMTPGLNLAQTEFRRMIRGDMGPEAQAQAIGQAAMGSLFMGTAAMLTHAGFVTGGGPEKAELKRQLMATGWQPYSFVIPGEDGRPTYVNFGRYDPIAMPFGIMADVVDILERDHDGDGFGEQAAAALGGVFLSLVKQLGQKTYLTSLNDTITAITSPERGLSKVAGQTAANFVPFASGLRFANPDPLMRETRGVVDKIMATVPGLSERLPARRDVFGDPLTVHKGLFVIGAANAVDAELRRMIDEAGVSPFGPPSSTYRGVDLRDIRTEDGRNAYEVYQELAGKPGKGPSLKETVARIMLTEAYGRAPDSDADQKGTRQAMLTGTVAKFREAAGKLLLTDANVRKAVFEQRVKGNAAVARRDGVKSDREIGTGYLERLGRATGLDLGGVLAGNE